MTLWATARRELGGFAEPLRHRPFRLLAIYTTLQSASSFSGFFFLYYLSDVIAPDFVLFGWHLTSDAVTAAAILQSVSQISQVSAKARPSPVMRFSSW